MQEITMFAFPAWEKYTNEYPQLISYGISTVEIQTNGIKYMVDLLEASLLKPTDMEIDRRKKVLDFSTGYYYYNVPDGAYYAKPMLPPDTIDSGEVIFKISGEASVKACSGIFFVNYDVAFKYYPYYHAKFQWLVKSENSSGDYRCTIDNGHALIFTSTGLPFTPTNAGTILAVNNYTGLYPIPQYSYLEVFRLPSLPPCIRGSRRTRGWDTPNVFKLAQRSDPNITPVNIDFSPGFPENPVIPKTEFARLYDDTVHNDHVLGDQVQMAERVCWEAHVTTLDLLSKQMWVPLNALIYDVDNPSNPQSLLNILGTTKFVVDDVRFPSLDDASSPSNFYGGSAITFMSYFPMLDVDGCGTVSQRDRDRYLNITGEKHYWDF
ncbi:MAG: hypothetical protein PHW04_16490 [Candidatus Wallbacteria bacterium]|nr:hypothetical protein [Candidatus Wallbacteria bacterium]